LAGILLSEALVLVMAWTAPSWLADSLPALSAAGGNGPAARALQLLSIFLPALPMGGTLPLLVRATVAPTVRLERTIGWLYAANTLGAALGAGLASWQFVPRWGVAGANSLAIAGTSVVVAASLVRMILFPHSLADPIAIRRKVSARSKSVEPKEPSTAAVAGHSLWTAQPVGPLAPRLLRWGLALAFAGGFISVGLEIIWFRVIDVAVKSTSLTYGTMLAVYLGGLAFGTFLAAGRREEPTSDPLRKFLNLQTLALLCAAIGLIVLTRTPTSLAGYERLVEYWRRYEGHGISPSGENGALVWLYFGLSIALMAPATTLFGAAFVHLQRAVQRDVAVGGWRVGQTQAAAIGGNVVGSLTVAFVLLPAVGTTGALRALLVVGLLWPLGRRLLVDRSRIGLVQFALLSTAAVAVTNNENFWLRLHGEPTGTWIVDEDADAVCAVLEPQARSWEQFDLRLSLNGKGISWFPYGETHSHLGWLPMLYHPQPRRAAIIGLGSGDTAWSAARRRDVEEITVFEICGGLHRMLETLNERHDLPQLREVLSDPRIRILHDDGRHALLRNPTKYDVIELDALRPQSPTAGNLYSVEFYRLCAARLAPNGIMCQWTPTIRTIRSFCHVFPHVVYIERGPILLGGNEPINADFAAIDALIADWDISAEQRSELMQMIRSARRIGSADLAHGTFNEVLHPRDEFAAGDD